MALYLEACLEEAGDDAAFVAKALGTIARAKSTSWMGGRVWQPQRYPPSVSND
jgi:DNA-binding phage protein